MVLVNAWDNLRESNDFKFYELRKIKICDPLTTQSIQNIAISNNIIFIATCDALKVIVVPLVLEFEWSPKIQNQILDTYNSVLIPLSIKPTYLTICGGKSGVLVVSGALNSNPNQTQIQFFDLTDLNAVNSDLKPFATIETNADIIGLDWHPEFNESLFIAVLSSGALISVGVNLPKKQARILWTLTQSEKITCASWSPKGKQFVIGKENGQIVQIKHKDGSSFEEAKKIQPDEELAGYEVNSIKWCFTQLFMVSYAKVKSETEFDVKHITVYAPPKTQPVFNNHTQLCIEQFRNGLRYKTDFVHLGSVILCSTSYSSEMGVLVCDNVEKSVHSWCQLMLADENRLDLPMIKNNQSLSKGLALYTADTRIFKISEFQTIGGRNCPLLMVISSDGILNNYYVTYPKLVCPTQLPTKQLEFQYVPPTAQQSVQIISQQPPLNMQQQQQQTPTKPITAPNQQQIQTNAQAAIQPQQQPPPPQQQQQQQLQQSQYTNQQLQQIQQQKALDEAQQKKMIALQIQQQKAKEAELQKEKERKLLEENHAYLVAIEEEVCQFSKLVLECKEKYRKTNNQIIGKENEKLALIELTNGLESDLNEIKEKCNNIDIELLENFLLENFAMAEDARSRVERENDTKLNILFKKKPLDPVTTRKLKEISTKTVYIETNLKEINYILDQQWQDYIVSEKGKGKKQNIVSPVNLIYQTLANNHRILNSLESQLRILEPVLPWKDANHKLNYKKQDIKKLTNILRKATILDESDLKANDNGEIDDEDNDDLIEVYKFTKKNKMNLLRILDSRPEIPVKRSTLPVDINSAIMISAVSKAKEKLKLSKKHVERNLIKHQQQRVNVPSSTLNKKLIEQQQQQKLVPTSKPVKATATFVPPVLSQHNQQQQISLNKQPIIPQKQTVVSKPMTSTASDKPQSASTSKNEPFKFSFNQAVSGDQQNKQVPFGIIDQNKSQQQQTAPQTSQQTTIKTTLPQIQPLMSSKNMFTSTNTATISTQPPQSDKTEFTFKPDQLNLTFDKSNLNLLSSTPIKNQQQKIDTGNKTVPLFGNSAGLVQTAKPVESATSSKVDDANKQPPTVTTTIATSTQPPLSKSEDVQKSTITTAPKYEDISPAITPTIDNLNDNGKQIDPTAFSFNALAALSKMPVSTTFQSPTISSNLFPSSTAPTSFQSPQINVAGNIQNLPKTAAESTTSQISLLPSTKPLFGQALTTNTATATGSTQDTIDNSQQPQPPAKDLPPVQATTAQSTTLFGNNNQKPITSSLAQTSVFGSSSAGFGLQSTTNALQSATSGLITTTAVSSANNSTMTTASSIFGMGSISTATSGLMNLTTTKKDNLPPVQTTTAQSSMIQSQQPSILNPTQTSNIIQSPASVFSSTSTSPQPFALQTSTQSTQPMQQQPQQSAFGFSSMCSLGGKPNPENANKNPFGGAISSSPAVSTSLFGSSTTTQQPTLFGSSFSSSNQTATSNQPISTGAFSSTSFGNAPAAFGSPPTFGTTSLFGNNSTSMISKPAFGFQQQQQQTQQPTSVFGQPQQTENPFQKQSPFQQTAQFGAKPTFGAQSSFGSPGSSFKFGSQPTFGSPNTLNTSFGSPQTTGFDSFANANVPTFGSFTNASGPTSFETISHNPAQQPAFGALGNNSTFGSPNPQFGGSQFSERRA